MRWITGLGDVIALSGAAVYLAWRYGKFIVPYQGYYETSVREIFTDIPEIELMVLEDALQLINDKGYIPDHMRLIVDYDDDERETSGQDNYQWQYAQHDIPYSERWAACPIPDARKRVEQLPVPNGKYIFLHDDVSRLMRIDLHLIPDMQVVNPLPGYSILAYCDLIEQADRLDVMDSVFFHLAEQLNPRGKKVLHHYAKGDYKPIVNDYLTKHNWEIIFK